MRAAAAYIGSRIRIPRAVYIERERGGGGYPFRCLGGAVPRVIDRRWWLLETVRKRRSGEVDFYMGIFCWFLGFEVVKIKEGLHDFLYDSSEISRDTNISVHFFDENL